MYGSKIPAMGEDATRGEHAADVRQNAVEGAPESGWLNTEVAAAALGVSPRTVRDYIQVGSLEAKAEGVGVNKRWLVSINSLQALREQRRSAGELPHVRRDTAAGEGAAASTAELAELIAAVQDLQYRLGRAEARAELTERAESTLREQLERERERADQERARAEVVQQEAEQFVKEREQAQEEANRLRGELEAERSKGFWRRLFGG